MTGPIAGCDCADCQHARNAARAPREAPWCYHCGGAAPGSVLTVVPFYDWHVCEDCLARRYQRASVDNQYYRTRDIMRAYDSGATAQVDYAVANWYQSEYTDAWFEDADNRAIYEENNLRAQQRQRTEPYDDRPLFAYHQTTVVDVHGWPSATPTKALCFGVELEMEHADDDSEDGQDALCAALGGHSGNDGAYPGRYILMQDGSLNASGVELITLPFTLDYHKTTFDWKGVLAKVAAIGRSGKGTSACGMHVHVNRAALRPLQIGKMLVFVNSDINKSLINYVAQRSETSYARKFPKKVTDGTKESESRYDALNVGYNTVEFRIFRGNLRHDRVLKNIEFCAAVASYCRDASVREVEEYTGFLKYVRANRGIYPNLFKWLEVRASFRMETVRQEEI